MATGRARANHQCSAVLSLKPQLRVRVLISCEKKSGRGPFLIPTFFFNSNLKVKRSLRNGNLNRAFAAEVPEKCTEKCTEKQFLCKKKCKKAESALKSVVKRAKYYTFQVIEL